MGALEDGAARYAERHPRSEKATETPTAVTTQDIRKRAAAAFAARQAETIKENS